VFVWNIREIMGVTVKRMAIFLVFADAFFPMTGRKWVFVDICEHNSLKCERSSE
jgi:hypothetical protein